VRQIGDEYKIYLLSEGTQIGEATLSARPCGAITSINHGRSAGELWVRIIART